MGYNGISWDMIMIIYVYNDIQRERERYDLG
jgi:hypothetical protein